MGVTGLAAGNFAFTASNAQLVFTGTGHTAIVNPGQALVNAASFSAGETPAGSVFTVFGANLAPTTGQPPLPLPTTFLTTSVMVNGEAAPLFYVSPSQINAQMPEDIPAGLVNVVVKVGSAQSNVFAATIPAGATPGIIVYGDNRAVVTDPSQGTAGGLPPVVSTSTPAKVGDTLVAYFTGGGPVTGTGIVTGQPTPGTLYPVSSNSTVAVAGRDAKVNYIGLTPGSIGLYQANFVLPQVAAGDRQLVITIGGKASNNPLIAVAN
jgi:adhesin/invasin